MSMSLDFRGQNIIVTGGGSGIGRAVVHELNRGGATGIIIGRDQEKLDRVVGEIKDAKGKAFSFSVDVREPEAVKAAVENTIKQVGQIHGLVNSAGGQYFSLLQDITPKGFDAVVKTNLHGTFHMMREVFLQSMKANGGSIVNVIANFFEGMPYMAHSGAARSGVDNLTKSAAFEWACYGIRVNSVAPGYVDSSGLENYPEKVRTWGLPKLKAGVPSHRLGTEEEISHAVCFLLSSAASFISGETLRVDGAALMVGCPWPLPEKSQ